MRYRGLTIGNQYIHYSLCISQHELESYEQRPLDIIYSHLSYDFMTDYYKYRINYIHRNNVLNYRA